MPHYKKTQSRNAPTYTVEEVCQLHHVLSYFCFALPKILKLQDKET